MSTLSTKGMLIISDCCLTNQIAHTHTCTIIIVPTPDGQQQIGELTVQLNQNLGDGSFGTVYKASYQGTPVAAKYLYHPVQDYEIFKHELENLQELVHPNLVAYYTEIMCPGPQSRRCLILVIELMERNLTQFLEEAENDIPVHLQVNLCLDITFALAYLHSQQIVHGHLTSNNVLLVGTTAKVADFGTLKLLDTQSSVTQSASYLPPEVRVSHPMFSEKSDVFSFGALVVQIITREAPIPTPREVPTYSTRQQQVDVISLGGGVVQIVTSIPQQQLAPLSEVDRRQQHIQKIASTHPLREIALQCLKDTAMERPTVKSVVTKLNAVKYHPQYAASLKQEREKVQQEVAQLKEKLKSKEELALKEKQENQKQMEMAKREIVQLQAELKSKAEFTQKQKQESEKQKEVLLQQVKEKDQEIASIRLTFGKQHQTVLALKKEVEVKSIQVQDRDKQILKQSQESQKQMGSAQREIAQLKGKLKSREEIALKEKQESQKQMDIAKQEIVQLKEKLKSKEELALKWTQESDKQMRLVQQKIAQLQAELKSKAEFTQKQKQESEKQKEVLLQQVKEKDQEIASIRLTFGLEHQTVVALKKEVEVKSIQIQDRDKQILKQSQESQKQMGSAKREIAQMKGELKSKEELALKERQESEKQMEKLQQQLKEKEQMITTVQTAYGTQHQALLVMTSKLQNESEGAQALRKELEEKVQDREEQIQACEMEVKKLLQESQKKDIKISELEAWKKTIKNKIASLASAAEQ